MDNVHQLLESYDGDHQLDVVDVLQNPQQAEDARVLATPTLIREQPLPIRVLVGDLSNLDRVREALNLSTPTLKEVPI
jgi:circadian clock protein KaiB